MAFRFRRSIRVAPGIRLNFGKKGMSVSAGVRGASINIGPRGTYGNVGLPGTGISYRGRLDSGTRSTKSQIVRQQRIERQQLKVEQERKRQEALSRVKLSLDKETGSVSIVDAHGAELSRKDLKLVWEQKAEAIAQWLEREAEEINGDVELLGNIHHDTPPPDAEPEYKVKGFPEFALSQPILPETRPQPARVQLPPLNFFLSLFRSKREAHALKQQELDAVFGRDVLQWQQAKQAAHEVHQARVAEYDGALARWRAEEAQHRVAEQSYKASFPALIRSDIDTMEQLLEAELNSLIWPRETLVSYQIANAGKEVWLDVDLPEIEDMPSRVATIHASAKKLVVKDKAQKHLQLEYASHIFGVAFRLVGITLSTLPTAERVIISGFSQRLNAATGSIVDEYLYSINIDRDGFSRVNFDTLDQVDPVETMRSFACRLKLSATGVFKGIEPFVPN